MSIHERLLRNQRLRNLVPPRAKAAFAENRVLLRHVARRSDVRNIYHCCVHKTGSQWIRKVFADPEIYRVTGLRTYAYGPRLDDGDRNRSYPEVSFDRPFPVRRIVSPLYIPYESFVELPKPEPWRAFFVLRDPRDIVVSWYFSSKSSHPTNSSRGLQRTPLHCPFNSNPAAMHPRSALQKMGTVASTGEERSFGSNRWICHTGRGFGSSG